eukprot:CAMPEP_0170302116 /NCGR_PEP_ID=MMETSP0116_2-20130129/51333_1 /TAXON_ID=400756 /ORGANISM="Durinskia baltica, Strain CSIRO CS-38" /LENGTH=93 /DNA_ID=CAMNT_0010553969 /DNA_START=460 /DNA_END=739 /DNA_ORIENTATION=+
MAHDGGEAVMQPRAFNVGMEHEVKESLSSYRGFRSSSEAVPSFFIFAGFGRFVCRKVRRRDNMSSSKPPWTTTYSSCRSFTTNGPAVLDEDFA